MPKCRFFPPGLSAWKSPAPSIRQGGLVRRSKIRRASEEPGNVLREHVQHLARGFPPGDALRVGRKDGEVAVPTGRQLAPLHQIDLGRQFGILGAIGCEEFRPLAPSLRAARADPGREVLVDTVGDEKLRVFGPSVAALGKADLLVAERLAVGFGGVLLVRGTVADVAVENDEGRAALRLPEDLKGVLDAIDVVGVADPQNVPPVTQEPGRDVLREGDARVPLDGDVVVVVDPAEVVEAQVAGQRRRFRRNALHHAAVSANGIDVVVEDLEAGPVVAVGEPLLGDGHAHARGDALPERTGGGLDARDPVVLGVTRGLAVELAEAADVVERHRGLPQPLVFGIHRLRLGEVEHGPEQHRGVTVREHEPIAVGPDRVLRIEAHDAVPDRVDQRRERHRRAGVSGLGLLDRVHRKRANGIDTQLIEFLVCHWFELRA